MSQIDIKKIITKLNFISINRVSIIKSGKNSKIYKIDVDKKKNNIKIILWKKKTKNKKRIPIL